LNCGIWAAEQVHVEAIGKQIVGGLGLVIKKVAGAT